MFTHGLQARRRGKTLASARRPQLRERRRSFRCSTDCACEAAAAFCRVSVLAALAVGRS